MVDSVDTIKTVLTADWNNSNTDSITPTIDFVGNHKLLDMNNNDYVLIYEIVENQLPFALGGTSYEKENPVSIDIRTTYKGSAMADVRAHLIKIKDEIDRIVKANVDSPDSDWKQLLPLRRKDLSDKNRCLGRMVIDVQLKVWG